MKKNVILGVGVTNQSEKEILEYIVHAVEKTREKFFVVTPNPEILVYANHHKTFQNILNNAKISLADGVGVVLAGKFLGKPFAGRVTGTDFLEKLCFAVSKKPITVGFLGAKPTVAEKTAECLKLKFPSLKVAFAVSELSELEANIEDVVSSMYHVVGNEEKKRVLRATNYVLPATDILFVAYGFPKQEEFMAQNLRELPVRVMIGVGGAFDYISGKVPRAPKILRNMGMEWLFRLFVQPWRMKRQVTLLEFVWLVVKEKLMM